MWLVLLIYGRRSKLLTNDHRILRIPRHHMHLDTKSGIHMATNSIGKNPLTEDRSRDPMATGVRMVFIDTSITSLTTMVIEPTSGHPSPEQPMRIQRQSGSHLRILPPIILAQRIRFRPLLHSHNRRIRKRKTLEAEVTRKDSDSVRNPRMAVDLLTASLDLVLETVTVMAVVAEIMAGKETAEARLSNSMARRISRREYLSHHMRHRGQRVAPVTDSREATDLRECILLHHPEVDMRTEGDLNPRLRIKILMSSRLPKFDIQRS